MPDMKCLSVNSYDELLEKEKEILQRIEAVPNGGNLFLINPFLLFEDIGVVLSEKAKTEILAVEPHLSGLSSVPYKALKTSKSSQSFRIHLKGLFQRKVSQRRAS